MRWHELTTEQLILQIGFEELQLIFGDTKQFMKTRGMRGD